MSDVSSDGLARHSEALYDLPNGYLLGVLRHSLPPKSYENTNDSTGGCCLDRIVLL